MKTSYWVLCFALVGTSICRAEELISPPTAGILKVFSFVSDAPSKAQKNFGKLRLIEGKKNVKIEFDGTGLKQGQYQIVTANSCKLPKGQKRMKPIHELLTFKTQSGEVFSEENLTFSKIDELEVEKKSIVLLKIEKQQDKVIACAILKPTQPD